ncbi:MAG: YlbF family regulator [Verrucomicrobiales bacterium]|nr:YlbF family regulator [Verrucomicrobiales bacterium]
MATTTETAIPTLEEKTRELCQFILEDPAYAAASGSIDTFQESEEAQKIYRNWQQKAAELHHMHHEGKEPEQSDIVELERLKQVVMDNQIAADFVEAEDSVNDIFGTVMKMVQKTLQNGSIPTEDDLNECCGNSGCGCH